jgi:fatty acid desaturase
VKATFCFSWETKQEKSRLVFLFFSIILLIIFFISFKKLFIGYFQRCTKCIILSTNFPKKTLAFSLFLAIILPTALALIALFGWARAFLSCYNGENWLRNSSSYNFYYYLSYIFYFVASFPCKGREFKRELY